VRLGLTGLLLYYVWSGAGWARVLLGVASAIVTLAFAIFAFATTLGPIAVGVMVGVAFTYALVSYALLVSPSVRAYLDSNRRSRS
jgi:hypothetical protein